MQTIRFTNNVNGVLIKTLSCQLLQANAAIATNTKVVDSVKNQLSELLKRERDIDIPNLAVGDLINVTVGGEDVLRIDRGSQSRIDQKALQVAHPELVNEFTRNMPVTRWTANKGLCA